MLDEKAKDHILKNLMKGFSIDVKFNIWKKLANVFKEAGKDDEYFGSMGKALIGMSPFAMLKFNGNLNIEINEKMQEKIYSNPLLQPMMVSAHSLIT